MCRLYSYNLRKIYSQDYRRFCSTILDDEAKLGMVASIEIDNMSVHLKSTALEPSSNERPRC